MSEITTKAPRAKRPAAIQQRALTDKPPAGIEGPENEEPREEAERLHTEVTELKSRLRAIKMALHGDPPSIFHAELLREIQALRNDFRLTLRSELEAFGHSRSHDATASSKDVAHKRPCRLDGPEDEAGTRQVCILLYLPWL